MIILDSIYFFIFTLWVIFVFAWTHSAILLAEYEFMTRGAWNFTEENEIKKVVRKYWVCCKFIWVYWIGLETLFPLVMCIINVGLLIDMNFRPTMWV